MLILYHLKKAVQNETEVTIMAAIQKSTTKKQTNKKKSLQAINADEGVEKREPSYTVGGNAN